MYSAPSGRLDGSPLPEMKTIEEFTLPEDVKAQMQNALDEVNKEIDNYLEKHGGVVL